MVQNFTLHLDVAHDSSSLKIFEQDNALKPYFVFVITLLAMVHALITPDQIVEDETKVIAQVLELLIDDYLMIAWELDLIMLDQLRQVTN